MFDDWIYIYLPSTFCALAFLVNPIFITLIFSEKSAVFGNYRYLFLYFAVFNMIYSMMNALVPLDIHNFRYSFFVFVRNGWFQTSSSEFNYHVLTARCSFIGSSYAVLLSQFIYRYLVILNSSLTRQHFPWYMTGSFLLLLVYYSLWYATCYFPGKANLELLQYIRENFQENFGIDSRNLNMMGSMFSVIHFFSSHIIILMFQDLRKQHTVMDNHNKFVNNVHRINYIIFCDGSIDNVKAQDNVCKNKPKNFTTKFHDFQFELLRALIVQTFIPIFISFSPCLLCWYSAMFGIQLNKSFNYFESIALGVFSFVDPIAIIFCLPIFRRRILNAINCFSKTCNKNSTIFIT